MLDTTESIPHWKEMNDLCRLCLSDTCTLIDLFAACPRSLDDSRGSLSIIDKILDSTSVKILETDKLPRKVCSVCCEEVEKIHRFKQNCLASDSQLRKHVKHKHQHEETELPLKGINSGLPEWNQCLGPSEETAGTSGTSRGCLHDKGSPEAKLDFDPSLLTVEIKEEDESMFEKCESSSSIDEDENFATEHDKSLSKSKGGNKMGRKTSKYTCQLCGKSFCNKYSLSRHKWSHSKQILTCTYCAKTFRNQESWLRHERMHQGGNRYRCHVCSKSYVSSSSHAAHVRKHTGERPFRCSDCNETFYLVSSYERHVAKHRGVKDYKCEICNAVFWVADDLRAHVNRMH